MKGAVGMILVVLSFVVVAAAPGGKEGKEKGQKKEMKAKAKEKGKGKSEAKRARAKAKKDKLKGIERKIERLREIADRLEKKGKADQAKRIRDRVAKAEAKLAKKKPTVTKEIEELEVLE